jgi:hypothetical protein
MPSTDDVSHDYDTPTVPFRMPNGTKTFLVVAILIQAMFLTWLLIVSQMVTSPKQEGVGTIWMILVLWVAVDLIVVGIWMLLIKGAKRKR